MWNTIKLRNIDVAITIYAVNFEGLIFLRKASLKGLIFADHQVEYIVSLSHCFLLRIKIFKLIVKSSQFTSLKISTYTVHEEAILSSILCTLDVMLQAPPPPRQGRGLVYSPLSSGEFVIV